MSLTGLTFCGPFLWFITAQYFLYECAPAFVALVFILRGIIVLQEQPALLFLHRFRFYEVKLERPYTPYRELWICFDAVCGKRLWVIITADSLFENYPQN